MWEKESILAREVVNSVSNFISQAPTEKSINQKSSPRDLVTSIDIAVEKECKKLLSQSGIPTLGEETYYQNNEFPEAPYWCLDPIDGTLNFISGFPYYGTSLGLYTGQAKDGFVVGAISLPRFGEYYYTINRKAYLNDRLLSVNNIDLSDGYLIDCFTKGESIPEDSNSQYEIFDGFLKNTRGVLRIGSVAAAICLVVSGNAAATIGRKCEIWDAAAGLAIANYSGCACWYKITPNSTKIDFIIGSQRATQSLLKHQKLMKFLGH